MDVSIGCRSMDFPFSKGLVALQSRRRVLIEIAVNGTRIYIAVSGDSGNSGLAKTALQRLGSDDLRYTKNQPLQTTCACTRKSIRDEEPL